MCIYIYINVYIYMYTYVFVYVNYMNTYIYIHILWCVYVYTYITLMHTYNTCSLRAIIASKIATDIKTRTRGSEHLVSHVTW